MDYLVQFSERAKAKFLEQVRPDIIAMAEREYPITWNEYRDLRLNSYERRLLYGNLDDEALLEVIKQHLRNCSYRPTSQWSIPATYDESLLGILLPELLKRLEVSNV